MGLPPLTDGHVTLRPWRLSDARWYAAATKDPDIQRWTSEQPDLTAARVRHAISGLANREGVVGYAICDARTGRRLGNIGLIVEGGGVADVGYWIAPAERGRGAAVAALRLISDWAVPALGLRALVLWTRVGNAASQRVAERAGFRRDPGRDGQRVVKGEVWDIEYFVRDSG